MMTPHFVPSRGEPPGAGQTKPAGTRWLDGPNGSRHDSGNGEGNV